MLIPHPPSSLRELSNLKEYFAVRMSYCRITQHGVKRGTRTIKVQEVEEPLESRFSAAASKILPFVPKHQTHKPTAGGALNVNCARHAGPGTRANKQSCICRVLSQTPWSDYSKILFDDAQSIYIR